MEYKDATDIIAGLHNVLDWAEAKITGSWVHRAFWHTIRVKWYTPPVLGGISWELDEPFRKGYTLIVRYWWKRCLVLGFWGKTHYDEDQALLSATIHGRKRTDDERDAWDDLAPRDTRHDYYTVSPGRAKSVSGLVLKEQSGLRVRATVDARTDG